MFDCLRKFPDIVVNPKCYYNHYVRDTSTTANFSINRVNSVVKSASHEKKLVDLLKVGENYWEGQIIFYFKLYLNELMKNRNIDL